MIANAGSLRLVWAAFADTLPNSFNKSRQIIEVLALVQASTLGYMIGQSQVTNQRGGSENKYVHHTRLYKCFSTVVKLHWRTAMALRPHDMLD